MNRGNWKQMDRRYWRYWKFTDWDWEASYAILLFLLLAVLVSLAIITLITLPIYFLWNWLVPSIFGLKQITFWQGWLIAFAIAVFSFLKVVFRRDKKKRCRFKKRRHFFLKKILMLNCIDIATGLI